MAVPVSYLLVVVTVLFAVNTYADMYYKQPSMMMSRPGKVIHVHHYDAGMSNNHMSSSYKKHESGGGSSLIELLILSSLLGGTGLTGTTGTQTALVNGQLVPIQTG